MVSAVSGTNIDVNTLVSQLMAAERAPLAALQRSQSGFQSKISAFGRLQSALSGVGDAAKKLDAADTFRAATAKAGDSAVFSASASTGAAAGTYSVEVQQLAQAQKLASAAYSASTSVVGSGTMTIQFGTYASGPNTFTANAAKPALNVVIGTGNNTLAGVRDAINAASAAAGSSGGVRASIVNDGSGYRLALTSADGGLANSFKIATVDDDLANTDSAGLSRLAFDPTLAVGAGKNLTQNAAAQDARLLIDGIQVTSSSNTIADAVGAVTLNLAKTNIGAATTLTVAADTDSMKGVIEGFVKAYNSFNTTSRDLTFYDAGTRRSGALQGDATARGLQSQVRAILTTPISGMSGNLTSLSQVGLTVQNDGSLAFDSTKFQKAADSYGSELAALFGTAGRATDGRVSFLGASSSLATGSFSVALSQGASRGRVDGNGVAALAIGAGANDTLDLSVDGTAVSVTLGSGAYATSDALAAEIQSKVNGNATLRNLGLSVTVSQSAGVLNITSNAFGSGSAVGVPSGNAAAGLFGPAPTASAGNNVAGTINGAAAVGSGQTLTSIDGLRLKVSADSAGALGSVSFTRGFGTLLNDSIRKLADTSGPIGARTQGLNASVKRVGKQQDDFNRRMDILESNYRRQFTALDTMLSSMNTTSSFLTQQLAGLARNNR